MKEKLYHLGVKALIQNASGDILLLKGNPEKFPDAHWDLLGGRILEGQTIEETLFREVQEETGITHLYSLELMDTLISNIEIPLPDGQTVGLILSVYRCLLEEFPFITLSAEHTEYSWSTPEKASILLLHKYPKTFIEKLKTLTLNPVAYRSAS